MLKYHFNINCQAKKHIHISVATAIDNFTLPIYTSNSNKGFHGAKTWQGKKNRKPTRKVIQNGLEVKCTLILVSHMQDESI